MTGKGNGIAPVSLSSLVTIRMASFSSSRSCCPWWSTAVRRFELGNNEQQDSSNSNPNPIIPPSIWPSAHKHTQIPDLHQATMTCLASPIGFVHTHTEKERNKRIVFDGNILCSPTRMCPQIIITIGQRHKATKTNKNPSVQMPGPGQLYE